MIVGNTNMYIATQLHVCKIRASINIWEIYCSSFSSKNFKLASNLYKHGHGNCTVTLLGWTCRTFITGSLLDTALGWSEYLLTNDIKDNGHNQDRQQNPQDNVHVYVGRNKKANESTQRKKSQVYSKCGICFLRLCNNS